VVVTGSRESGGRPLFRRGDVRCLACGGFLRFLADSYPLAFRCQSGHSLTLQDLIEALLLPENVPSDSTLSWWQEKSQLLRRLAGRALKCGHPLAAADLQEAAVRVDQWTSRLGELMPKTGSAEPRTSRRNGGKGIEASPAARAEAVGPEAGRPLVVCVDDEPPVLAALSRVLRDEPYEFRTTTDPEEALDWVRSQGVSVLVADYRMPQMSGTTLLQIAKAASPRTARMMLTGYPTETIVVSAGETGLMHLVRKPWDNEALKQKIRGLLAGPQEEAEPRQELGGEG
jgi:CheY-like chemotaxis protein